MISRLRRAARRRLDGRGSDQGSALLFVLMVTTVVMIAITAVLVSVTGAVLPGKHDQDTQSALAAAEAGVQDAMAYVSGIPSCNQINIICSAALNANSATLGRSPLSGGCESVTWKTDPNQTQDGYVRVRSTGKCDGINRTLVADIALAPNIFSFGYYSDYESTAPSVLQDMYGARTISIPTSTEYKQITSTSVNAATSATWNGTTTTAPIGVDTCGHHYYDDSPTSPGRYTLEQQRTSLPSGYDYGETGKVASKSVTRYGSCNIVFTSGMVFNGQVYSRDAMYLSNGTSGGSGPDFEEPVSTLWSNTDNPAAPSNPWRVDSQVGGNVDTADGSYAPKTASFDLQLPSSIGTKALPGNYCIYLGPTRVLLNGDGTATVTSPQTTTADPNSDPGCYPSTLTNGVINFTLNYATVGQGTIYVKNNGTPPSTGWPAVGTKSTNTPSAANTIFYQSSLAGVATAAPAATAQALDSGCTSGSTPTNTYNATCAWSDVKAAGAPGWTTYTGTNCNGVASTDEKSFDCDWMGVTNGNAAASYGTFRTAFKNELGGNLPASCGAVSAGTATTAQLNCALTAALQGANTGDLPAGTTPTVAGSEQYVVSTGATASTTAGAAAIGAAPTAPLANDPLFATKAGTAATAQQVQVATPFTVSRQVSGCYANLTGLLLPNSNSCTAKPATGTFKWGPATAAFTVAVSQTQYTNFVGATSAASYFPNVQDVTSYNTGTAGANGTNGPGDLYVEGVNSGRLSLLSDNDLIVTDDITDKSSDPTVNAVDLVAGNNVRNYNPVKCTDQVAADINATTAGFCPNDITGLTSNALESNGVLNAAHPAMQYVNLACSYSGVSNQNDAANNVCPRQIDAAVFALSGSFLTDNYLRGGALGQLTINGGLYQSYRGANGIQWAYSTGDRVRPSSGYKLNYNYVNLQVGRLPYAPPTKTGTVTKTWNIVSVSESGS